MTIFYLLSIINYLIINIIFINIIAILIIIIIISFIIMIRWFTIDFLCKVKG